MKILFGTMSIMAGVYLVCQASIATGAEKKTDIKIGYMSGMTGIESGEAKNLMNALNLAVKELNDGGGVGGQKIKIVVEDTRSAPKPASEAYEKLVNQEDVVAVIAPFKSAQIVAIIPKGSRSLMPTIIGGTAPRLTDEGSFVIRTRPNDRISAAAMVKYIKENTKFKSISVLNDDGAFGMGGANLISKFAPESGLNVVKKVTFKIGEKNFAPYLQQIKESGAEVLVVYDANMEEASNIIIEFAKLKSKMMYLGSPSSQGNFTLETAKESAEGIYAVVDVFIGQSPESTKYRKAYKKAYSEEPDSIAAYTYDGVMLIAKAMKEVGPTRAKIREAILNFKNYHGVMGEYHFQPNGEGLTSVGIVKIEHGQRKLAKTMDVAL